MFKVAPYNSKVGHRLKHVIKNAGGIKIGLYLKKRDMGISQAI